MKIFMPGRSRTVPNMKWRQEFSDGGLTLPIRG